MPNLEEVDWSYTEILISFDNEKFLIQVNSLILLGRKMSKYQTSIFARGYFFLKYRRSSGEKSPTMKILFFTSFGLT